MNKRGKLALGLIGLMIVWLVLVAGVGAFTENSALRESLQLAGPVLAIVLLVVGHFALGEDENATPQ